MLRQGPQRHLRFRRILQVRDNYLFHCLVLAHIEAARASAASNMAQEKLLDIATPEHIATNQMSNVSPGVWCAP
jgi:hypothetical protein